MKMDMLVLAGAALGGAYLLSRINLPEIKIQPSAIDMSGISINPAFSLVGGLPATNTKDNNTVIPLAIDQILHPTSETQKIEAAKQLGIAFLSGRNSTIDELDSVYPFLYNVPILGSGLQLLGAI